VNEYFRHQRNVRGDRQRPTSSWKGVPII